MHVVEVVEFILQEDTVFQSDLQSNLARARPHNSSRPKCYPILLLVVGEWQLMCCARSFQDPNLPVANSFSPGALVCR